MVVVQVRSQMVSNNNVPGHSRFEKALLYVARELRPQCGIYCALMCHALASKTSTMASLLGKAPSIGMRALRLRLSIAFARRR
jgi:hypothetical protein